jgi:hypothetical protein
MTQLIGQQEDDIRFTGHGSSKSVEERSGAQRFGCDYGAGGSFMRIVQATGPGHFPADLHRNVTGQGAVLLTHLFIIW